MSTFEQEAPLQLDNVTTADAQQRRPRFQFVNGSELAQPIPPKRYWVPQLMPEGAIVIIGGYGGTAKTWFAYDLGISVAHGVKWMGHDTTRGAVAVFDYEQGPHEVRRRMQALGNGRGLTTLADTICVSTPPEFPLSSADFLPAFAEVIPSHELIIFDSLRAATPGFDENDSAIRTCLDDCRKLPGAQAATLVFLAHARKGGGEAREQLRGSGAIYDAADVVLMLAEKDEGFVVTPTKNRFGGLPPSFAFRVEDVAGGAVVLSKVSRVSTSSVSPLLKKKVLRAITGTPGISVRALRAMVGGKASHVDEAARELATEGLITRQARGGYAASRASTGGAP